MTTMQLKRAARVILVGAPGVGKGTQAERLMKRFPQISAVSSGDLLRTSVREKTPLGKPKKLIHKGTFNPHTHTSPGLQAKATMTAGDLVPDDMILRLILNELKLKRWLPSNTSMSDAIPARPSEAPSASFILDGFPRTAGQAQRLDSLIPINLVVSLITPVEIILGRIASRWVHAPSGRVYNTDFNAPKVAGLDDVTGEKLTKREDDDEETWKQRLKRHDETSAPLLEHYGRKGVLWEVKGNSSDEISPKLFEHFEKVFC
jgi:adenylate kinase